MRMRTRQLCTVLLVILALVGFGVATGLAQAQELPRLEYDSARGVFTLWYWADLDDRVRSQEIVPGNRVRSELELSVKRGPPRQYLYRLTNRDVPGSSQELVLIEAPCPSPSGIDSVVPPRNWNARVFRYPDDPGYICKFSRRSLDASLAPGESTRGFVLTSDRPPDLVTARALGQAPPHPDLVGVTELNPLVGQLRNVASGVYEGPGDYDFPAVMPAANPLPTRAIEHVRDVRDDVGEVCDVRWIDESRICQSLEKKLVGAIDALERNDPAAARAELESFLSELDVRRGKHVNENAYWLLYLHVRDILDSL